MDNLKKSETKSVDEILETAEDLRWSIGQNIHESLVEEILKNAAQIADKVVVRTADESKSNFDHTLDRIVTNRITGIPIMLILLTLVFWLTITGANYPSSW